VAQALFAVETVAADLGLPAVRACRHRLEHVELIHHADIERMRDLGMVASVQPAFDAAWGGPDGMYAARLGPQRAVRMNPFGTMAAARNAYTLTLPAVTADARSVRQILFNLLSNSIKFTGVGGQVIVSTARSDDGEVVLRVRDTGVGMSEQDIAVAMEPFRQLATSARWGSGGTGLGLPLTKALAEANRASFKIRSAVNTGTLVEVAFPGSRMAAE